MRITGRVVSKSNSVAGAKVRLWIVKRSEGAEIEVYVGETDGDGTFEVTLDVIDGIPCNSQNFGKVRYSIEKAGYRTAGGTRPIVGEEIKLGDIELVREALQVHGRVISNSRPVRAAKIIVRIDEVERVCIRTGHDGTFDRHIEGNYDGRKLEWTAKRSGYINETGLIPDIRSNQLDLGEIRLVPHWWMGMCQSLGIDPRIALAVGVALIVGLAIVLYIKPPLCGKPSVSWKDFEQAGKEQEAIEAAFDECLSTSEGKCAAEGDKEIIQCMEYKRYKHRK